MVWSLDGWRNIWKTETSLKHWIFANCVSAALDFYLPLPAAETAIIIMGGILVLAAECINTAIERVVDDIGMECQSCRTAISVSAVWIAILVK